MGQSLERELMRLRTSRWILRFILLPFLLFVIGGLVFTSLLGPTGNDPLVAYLIGAVAVAIPGVIIYAIWKGADDSARISERRRRRRQATRDKAKTMESEN